MHQMVASGKKQHKSEVFWRFQKPIYIFLAYKGVSVVKHEARAVANPTFILNYWSAFSINNSASFLEHCKFS